MNLLDDVLKGASIQVEVAGLPPITTQLDSSAPSPLLQVLRPRITVIKQGVVLASVAPYGPPDQGAPWAALALGAGIIGFGLLVFFAVR